MNAKVAELLREGMAKLAVADELMTPAHRNDQVCGLLHTAMVYLQAAQQCAEADCRRERLAVTPSETRRSGPRRD